MKARKLTAKTLRTPTTRENAIEFLRERHRFYRSAFGLNHIETTVLTATLEEGVAGRFVVHPSYERACISIDPDQCETLGEVEDTLRHEMIHVALSPFNSFAFMIEGETKVSEDLYHKLVDDCQERLVSAVERILSNASLRG